MQNVSVELSIHVINDGTELSGSSIVTMSQEYYGLLGGQNDVIIINKNFQQDEVFLAPSIQ